MRSRHMIPLLLSLLAGRGMCDYSVDAADSAAANELYGIQAYSNAASKTDVKVQGGVVVLSETLASDSAAGKPVAYSANAGLLLPLCKDWSSYDLTGLSSVDFEYRNSAAITDYFAISFGSSAYPEDIAKAGTGYEFAFKGTRYLGASSSWKAASATVVDFATPSWLNSIPDGLPTIDSVLKEVKNLQFIPKTNYASAGVGPTMTSQTLEIRNVVLHGGKSVSMPLCGSAGVVRAAPSMRFHAEYRDGIIALERLDGYATVEVVSASGRRVAAFDAGAARMSVALDAGTWFVVARGPGKPMLVRPLAVTR